MNNDAPYEMDGMRLLVKRLEITCYEYRGRSQNLPSVKEGFAYKVVANTLIGKDQEVHIEMTDSQYGEDPEEVKQKLVADSKLEVAGISPYNIITQEVYFGKYSKVRTWKEAIKEELTLESKEKPTKEQQINRLRRFFSVEFGLGVEEFISLKKINPDRDFSDNLDDLREELRELMRMYPRNFYERMNNNHVFKFEQWLRNEY
jgi:hypothetical protein